MHQTPGTGLRPFQLSNALIVTFICRNCVRAHRIEIPELGVHCVNAWPFSSASPFRMRRLQLPSPGLSRPLVSTGASSPVSLKVCEVVCWCQCYAGWQTSKKYCGSFDIHCMV